MESLSPRTYQKAVQINHDLAKYGTFAEIGAGQEVAGWFFHVGRASNTVAKTISAYDMAVSDAVYGRCERYVSRQRLEAMLDHEFALLLERLQSARGDRSTFFVFADTVATSLPAKPQQGHGWLGVRFQTQPNGLPSEVIIHVQMHDRNKLQAHEALGIVGVNLIHAALFSHQQPSLLLAELMDDLTRERVEIDMVKLSGPAFADVDARLMSLQLVEKGFTDAAMFLADGTVVQPSEVLYKRPILVERGRFRPITNLTLDVLRGALRQFWQEPRLQGETPVVLMEMTLRDLAVESAIDYRDFLARVDILRELGQMVLISNYITYFRLVEYLSRYSEELIGIALGVPSLRELTQPQHYADLPGGALEAAGRLFRRTVKVYVHPYLDRSTGELVTAETLQVPPDQVHLLTYLRANGFIEPVHDFNVDYLPIRADEVLAKIASGDPGWESMVPLAIVRTIKRDRLFGWRAEES